MLCEKCNKEIKRTEQQNNAMHKFFNQVADELNNAGMDMRTIIRDDIEIQWTPNNVKEQLWKPLQYALFGKRSTTQLKKTGEIDTVYDNLNRIITERTNGWVILPPFPSEDVDN